MAMDLFTCHGKDEIKLLLSIFMRFIILFLNDKVLLASELTYVFEKDGGRNSNAETTSVIVFVKAQASLCSNLQMK